MLILSVVRVLALTACVFATLHNLASIQDEESNDGESSKSSLIYDGRVGPIKVGVIEAHLTIQGQSYELEGSISGAGPIARLLDWKGEFAATGILEEGIPITKSYLLTEVDEKDGEEETKTIHVFDEIVVISETGKPQVERPKPHGIDMMTALFANSQCREEMLVHDGEDPFVIKLWKQKPDQKLRQGKNYYSGIAEMCRYRFIYDDDEVRKVDIWLGEVEGRIVTVRLSIRIPVIPNGVFKLRIVPPKDETDPDTDEQNS